jgi:hypothetical protein
MVDFCFWDRTEAKVLVIRWKPSIQVRRYCLPYECWVFGIIPGGVVQAFNVLFFFFGLSDPKVEKKKLISSNLMAGLKPFGGEIFG